MQRLMRGSFTAMLIAAIFVTQTFAAPLAQDAQAIIVSPVSGQTVSGLVPIFGTATASDFSRYELSFGPDPGDAWQVFASADIVLTNAQIGVWDTTPLAPGTYAVRLQVFRSDGGVAAETVVRGLIVGTPSTPTPPATPTNVPPAPTFEAETQATIQPTVIIEQPPTATPAPTFAAGAGPSEAGAPRNQGGGLDLSRVTSACINGVWCAVGAYFLLGAFVFGRWGARRILKQMRDRSNSR